MPTSPNIRQLYMPIQPTLRQAADNVSYTELLPDEQLLPYIYCYWELKTAQPLQEEFLYRVVADGCIDIYFELTDPTDAYVMGFCKQYTEFPLGDSFHYIGIRFLPTMFPQLFGVDAATLSNRYQHLADVVPQVADFLAEHLNGLPSSAQIKALFDAYFINLLGRKSFDDDKRLYGAIVIILQNFGVLNIETDLDTGISQRQLRRLFEFYIGDTAKTFAKVVRFQNILRAKPSSQSLRQNKLFFDAGYYDQAHFIKEFKNFYGVSPSKAFGR